MRALCVAEARSSPPDLREPGRVLHVAVPSRTQCRYRDLRHQVGALVERINGAFGTRWSVLPPYLCRSLVVEFLALHRVARVLLVTPISGGANLVAKRLNATRRGEHGVLVLSEIVARPPR